MKLNELYRFVQGTTVTTFTSSALPIDYGSETYAPLPIGRSVMESKTEISKSNIDIKLPITNAVARDWMNSVYETPISLTIFQQTDLDTEVTWKGRMAAAKPGTAEILFTFESIFTSLRRPGVRQKYQKTCPRVLYHRGCNLDKEDFAVAAVCTAVDASGKILTIPVAASEADGVYLAGMLKSSDGVLRLITKHVGDQVTISRPVASIVTGLPTSSVTIYPGCNRTKAVCVSRFNNLPNNGSFAYIPIRNPFTGTIE